MVYEFLFENPYSCLLLSFLLVLAYENAILDIVAFLNQLFSSVLQLLVSISNDIIMLQSGEVGDFHLNLICMARNFKGGLSSWLGSAFRNLGNRQLSSYMKMSNNDLDPTQLALLNEPCIAVDFQDQVTGSVSKKDAHLLGPENQLPPLHRAFSVFLFNTENELLMQQRSQCKITFPGIQLL